MFSILILTFNEEINIKDCIGSVKWSDDIVVLDSFSTDRTAEIAKCEGARVVHRVFDNFAAQRNFALESIPFKHPWIFHLDADERFTEALRQECEVVVAANSCSGCLVPNKLMLENRWLKYSGMYPTYQMRFLKLGEVQFIQVGHGQREGNADRGIIKLREPYHHYNFSKGLTDWHEKHERYALLEAQEAVRNESTGVDWAGLFNIFDTVRRRRVLKQMATKLPCRAWLRWFYMYVLRLGFLDGRAGWQYCRMLAWYESRIAKHIREFRARRT